MHLELVIVEGSQSGRHIPLVGKSVTFGRSSAAGISFPLDSFMSGMHLTVQNALSGVVLVDLNSSNGTFLNSERIRQAIAVPGDVIKIGTLTMKLGIGTSVVAEVKESQPTANFDATTLMEAFPEVQAMPEPLVVTEAVIETATGVLGLLSQNVLPLYCLLDAGVDEAIPALLGNAAEQRVSLHSGDPAQSASRPEPYLVKLDTDSSLLRTLAKDGWGNGWASFFVSQASFEELSEHFGKFYRVQLEAGAVYFRFYDPKVLREFLTVASSEELAVFFGPVDEWLLEAGAGASLLKAKFGSDGLQTETIPVG